MKQYLVISRQTCKECKGLKSIPTPLWGKFISFMDKWEDRYEQKYCYEGIGNFKEKVSIQDAWWTKRGYPGGGPFWPEREQKCKKCNGIGHIDQQVDFNEALASTLKLKLSA